MQVKEIDMLTDKSIKDYLKKLIEKLDELECEDFFGTEGWRHFVMGEE